VTAGNDPAVGARADAEASVTCSRAGCRETANWRVEWRNPRIHSPDRRKIWVACDEHRDFLRDYLAARDFPVMVAPLGLPASGDPS
jgi:hypothetical protein